MFMVHATLNTVAWKCRRGERVPLTSLVSFCFAVRRSLYMGCADADADVRAIAAPNWPRRIALPHYDLVKAYAAAFLHFGTDTNPYQCVITERKTYNFI